MHKRSWCPCMLYLKIIYIIIVGVICVCVCVWVSCLISKTLSRATGKPARHTPWSRPVMWVWEYLCSCASELVVLDVLGGWCSGAGVSLSKLAKQQNSSWGCMSTNERERGSACVSMFARGLVWQNGVLECSILCYWLSYNFKLLSNFRNLHFSP